MVQRKIHFTRLLLLSIWITILGCLWFIEPIIKADEPPTVVPVLPTVPNLPGTGPWVMKAYYDNYQQVRDLSAWTEPWEVNHEEGYVVVEVHSIFEYNHLEKMGFRLEIDQKLTEQFRQPNKALLGQLSGIPGYPCYRTVEETFATAQAITANYPNLASWIDIGDSWEKTQVGGEPGYDMMVLKLTNSAIPGPKPKMFMMSSVHAREYTPAELNTRFAEYLINNYGIDAEVTWLLDYHEFHLLLQANPDGRKRAETGLSWRKNTDNNYCANSNLRGVDLNRNFSFQWGCCGGSSGSQCSETYRGPTPASEPETQAVQNYVRSIFPDLRDGDLNAAAPITTTGIFLDIHSYSQLVLWPWGFTEDLAPNSTALQTLGRKLAYFNGYEPEQAIGLYPTDGTTDDFAYGDLGLPAYTYELGTNFFQDCATFENTILPDNMESLLYSAKTLQAPYLVPAGPEALNLDFSDLIVIQGGTVTLTATLNDTRYENQNGAEPTQNISQAVYYIETIPSMTNTGVVTNNMFPSDGNFNSSVEDAYGIVDSSSLSPGRYTIFVRGQDASGNWGTYSATFLNVVEPGVSPVIEGYVRDYAAQPLTAIVSAGLFDVATNPTTGYYTMTVLSDTYNLTAMSAGYAISTVTEVSVEDYQTIQQDFYLYPTCEVIGDDVENGNIGWTTNVPWAITTETANSPTHSWTDSPGTTYGNNFNISLTSPVFDLSDYEGSTLNFWHIYDLEDGYDYGYLEYSTDGGSTWTTVATYNGENPNPVWGQETIDLTMLDGESNVRLRFRLDTDVSVTEDGWHIDDIQVLGGGPSCITDFAPVVNFSVPDPAVVNTPIQFTNLTIGSPEPNYVWDFGDGLGSSMAYEPTYTYTNIGTFTVTLFASNTLGSDILSQTITVISPTYNVDLTVIPPTQTGLVGEDVTYTVSITNLGNVNDAFTLTIGGYVWTSTLLFDANWQGSGDIITSNMLAANEMVMVDLAVSIPLTVSTGATDTLQVTVTSYNDPIAQANEVATTTAVCNPVSILDLSSNSPVPIGEAMQFSTTISSASPVDYFWEFGGAGMQGGTLMNPTFIYSNTGVYTVTLSVVNSCPFTDTTSITVTVLAFNQAPLAVDDVVTTSQNIAVDVAVLDNDSDPDGGSLTVSHIGNPANGSTTGVTTTILYTPDTDFVGVDSFTYTVSDGFAESNEAVVTVNVLPVCDPLTNLTLWQTPAGSLDVGEPVTFTVSASGTTPFTYSWMLMDNAVGLNQNTFSHVFTTSRSYTVSITIVNDCDEVSTTLNMVVLDVNNAPLAVDDVATTTKNIALTIDVLSNDSDPDDDVITIDEVGSVANGSLQANSSTIIYTPTTDFVGNDSFTYTINDGLAVSTPATVSITVVDEQEIGLPDLSNSTKTAQPEIVQSGDWITYTIALVNQSLMTATATVTDPLPANTIYVDGSATASDSSAVTVTTEALWWSGEVISGTPLTIEFAVQVLTLTEVTTISNIATVDDGQGILTDLQADVVYQPETSAGTPDLQLMKAVSSQQGTLNLPLSTVLTYTIVLTNQGDGLATGVVITDVLPDGLLFGDWVVQNNATFSAGTIMWGPTDMLTETVETIAFTSTIEMGTVWYGQTITNTVWANATNATLLEAIAVITLAEEESMPDYIVYLPVILK